MPKTDIEWTNYSINPVKGLCPMDCKDNQGKPYCYARRMYKRFHWNPEIRFENYNYWRFPIGSKVFVGSTMELLGEWVKPEWLQEIFNECTYLPNTTFIFLTKRPENLIKWSPFPPNVWVGASATNYTMANQARYHLGNISAIVKFLSIEPLLEPLVDKHGAPFQLMGSGIPWLIVGAQTPVSPKTAPKVEWVREIIEAADRAGTPVFLKNNLMPLLKDCEGVNAPYWRVTDPDNVWPYARQFQLRQEFPVILRQAGEKK